MPTYYKDRHVGWFWTMKNIFGTKNLRRRLAKTERQLIRHIESKMKEFDRNFVESLLEGVKAKARSICDNGVCPLFKYYFFIQK